MEATGRTILSNIDGWVATQISKMNGYPKEAKMDHRFIMNPLLAMNNREPQTHCAHCFNPHEPMGRYCWFFSSHLRNCSQFHAAYLATNLRWTAMNYPYYVRDGTLTNHWPSCMKWATAPSRLKPPTTGAKLPVFPRVFFRRCLERWSTTHEENHFNYWGNYQNYSRPIDRESSLSTWWFSRLRRSANGTRFSSAVAMWKWCGMSKTGVGTHPNKISKIAMKTKPLFECVHCYLAKHNTWSLDGYQPKRPFLLICWNHVTNINRRFVGTSIVEIYARRNHISTH